MKEQTKQYINGLRENYEQFRNVNINRYNVKPLIIETYNILSKLKNDLELLANIFDADIPIVGHLALEVLIDNGYTEKQIEQKLGW